MSPHETSAGKVTQEFEDGVVRLYRPGDWDPFYKIGSLEALSDAEVESITVELDADWQPTKRGRAAVYHHKDSPSSWQGKRPGHCYLKVLDS